MSQSTSRPAGRPLAAASTRLANQPGLPFADLLPDDTTQVLGSTDDPIYPPQTTLALFLSQILDATASCRQAVARLLAWRTATGQPPCSAHDGAYCKARQRLPEAGLRTLARRAGADLSRQAPAAWRWRGRRVQIADGTTVTAADTPANQRAYPQPDGQQPGLGFPMLRLVVLFCLATGAVVETALAPYRGKGTGELALLRRVWHRLAAGDILLGDCIYCSYFEMALLQRRGIDVVLHKHQSRRTDFRTGRRLGRRDHVITWDKPTRPDWMSAPTYRALPATLTVREVQVQVSRPGFRVRRYEVITTLLAAVEFPAVELAELYRQRWSAELDLRSVKSALGMDQLRCKSPAMVRKELWVYLLGYNLIRGVMVAGALAAGVVPRAVSFLGALQRVRAFGAVLAWAVGAARVECLRRLWWAIGSHRVGDRPGRVEPRALKRRKNNYPTLSVPRKLAREQLLRTA